jgi:hypothetical protein
VDPPQRWNGENWVKTGPGNPSPGRDRVYAAERLVFKTWNGEIKAWNGEAWMKVFELHLGEGLESDEQNDLARHGVILGRFSGPAGLLRPLHGRRQQRVGSGGR